MNRHRPISRWVRMASIVTVLLTVLLLALGGFVTSFRVGMADPVWPTEPWFLLGQDWQQLEFGFLIEHVHRLAGWLTGLAVTVFVIGAWLAEPDRKLRFIGLLTIVGLLVSYGEFHRGMGKVWNEIQTQAKVQQQLDPRQPDYEQRLSESNILQQTSKWPIPQGIGTAAFAMGVLLFGVNSATRPTPGGSVRLLASVGLIMVMAQGLLGGFRVFLNALAGTNLAAIHGVFGQLTFAVLVAGMILCTPRREGDSLPAPERSSLLGLAWLTIGLLVLQLVWAVWVRHYGAVLAQRLHILTAFAATGILVWMALKILYSPTARTLYKGAAIHLLFILSVQVLLGVESYIGKFVAAGPQAQLLPLERQVTPSQAVIRTSHQLIGAGLLAATVAVGVRLGRRPLRSGSTGDSRPEIAEHSRRSPAVAQAVS